MMSYIPLGQKLGLGENQWLPVVVRVYKGKRFGIGHSIDRIIL